MNGRTRLRALLLTATIAALASTASAGAAEASTGAAPPGPTGPLDHFLCYTAKATTSTSVPGFTAPTKVKLQNQFNPNGFTAVVGALNTHCNPVQKTLPTGQVFKIQNPSWHLACWAIKPATAASVFEVKVTNQFGTAVLDTKRPTKLCLPSLKSEKDPPSFIPPGANEVQPDYFSCYPVAYVPGAGTFTPPPFVKLLDQFTPQGASYTVKIGAPTQLCLPTAVTLPKAQPTPVKNPREHLQCFVISGTNPATLPRTVFDRNLFGTGAVTVSADKPTLCLPSLKTIVTG